MTDRMAVIVPSRGRPANMVRLIQAWSDTQARADLIFGIDDDDQETFNKSDDLLTVARALDIPVTVFADRRTNMAGTLNRIAVAHAQVQTETAKPRYAYIGFMGDDHVPRTVGWDRILTGELQAHEPCIVYGDDLMQGRNLPTAVFMNSSIVAALGYMVPPGFKHLYLDNVWRDWGQGIKALRYVPEVVIEHLHPQAGKAEWDEGYVEVNGGATWEHDCEQYRLYCDGPMANDLAKLQAI